jgi:hypothetical protein
MVRPDPIRERRRCRGGNAMAAQRSSGASRRSPRPHSAVRRALALGLALAASTGASVAAAQPIGILTYNQYFGADISGLLQAPSPEAFNEALLDVLRTIAANRFPDRAALQARSIAEQRPDLVALQEVWRIACVDLGLPSDDHGCDDPEIAGAFNDQLQVTLDALDDLGADYSAAAFVINFNVEPDDPPFGIPFVINGYPAALRFADRDVILVNDDTTSSVQPVDFPTPPCRTSADGCNYNVVVPISVTVSLPGGGETTIDTAIERGYVGVDATVGGERYRLVNTHLEVKDPPIPPEFQCAQAVELLGVLAAVSQDGVPLLVAGDFNSGPDDVPLPVVLPTPPGLPPQILAACFGAGLTPPAPVIPPYMLLTGAGLSDIWTFRTDTAARLPPSLDGYTCCQPELLRNSASRLNDRIDLILSLIPPAMVLGAQVVGDTLVEKTFPYGVGIWPSDHGGVVANIALTANVAQARAARAQLAAVR